MVNEMSEAPETYRIFARTLENVAERLTAGWVFDPWLCAKGYPVMMGENTCYWVLVNPKLLTAPEQLEAAQPFMQLPVEPVVDMPAGYGTVYVSHQDGVDATEPWRAEGYVLLHKDHVTSKGTILTLTEKPEEVAG